jgi:hypothetical protein
MMPFNNTIFYIYYSFVFKIIWINKVVFSIFLNYSFIEASDLLAHHQNINIFDKIRLKNGADNISFSTSKQSHSYWNLKSH